MSTWLPATLWYFCVMHRFNCIVINLLLSKSCGSGYTHYAVYHRRAQSWHARIAQKPLHRITTVEVGIQ